MPIKSNEYKFWLRGLLVKYSVLLCTVVIALYTYNVSNVAYIENPIKLIVLYSLIFTIPTVAYIFYRDVTPSDEIYKKRIRRYLLGEYSVFFFVCFIAYCFFISFPVLIAVNKMDDLYANQAISYAKGKNKYSELMKSCIQSIHNYDEIYNLRYCYNDEVGYLKKMERMKKEKEISDAKFEEFLNKMK